MASVNLTASPVRDETSPLLAVVHVSDDPIPGPGHGPHRRTASREHGMVNPAVWGAVFVIFIILLEFGAYLIVLPLNQILEHIICRKHHPMVDLDSENHNLCKDMDVQAELAMLRGWQTTLEFIPGLVTAVFYGFAADKYGRKIIFSLSLMGIVLFYVYYIIICALPNVFPVWMTLLSAMFLFIGGGPSVFVAMLYSMATDISTVTQRSTMFFYLASASVVGELIASPTVYFLMRVNAWLPILLGLGGIIFSLGVSLFLPDTRDCRCPQDRYESNDETITQPMELFAQWRTGTKNLTSIGLSSMWEQGKSMILLTFLLTTLGRYAQEILLQYVTKRYGWSWSQAGLLLSVRASCIIALLVVILPLSGRIMTRRLGLSPLSKDLWLARGSAFLLAAGSLIIGLADITPLLILGLALYALGSGYNLLARSILASMGAANTGVIFTTISLFENIGGLISGPLLATSFTAGLGWGGGWIGLPFIVAGCLFSAAFLLVACARLSSLEPLTSEEC